MEVFRQACLEPKLSGPDMSADFVREWSPVNFKLYIHVYMYILVRFFLLKLVQSDVSPGESRTQTLRSGAGCSSDLATVGPN